MNARDMNLPVRGSGGGGGGKGGGGGSARVAVESPDSLRSRQYAHVLDMVSEGEIEGLVGGLRGVYLDDTPIENSDGTANFTGVTVDSRNGTQAQSYLPGFAAVENEVSVSTEVKYGVPVVRQISNPNINAARVTIGIPQLTYQNPTNGDLSGTSVEIALDVQTDGGGWVPAKLRTVDAALAVVGLTAHSNGADILSASFVLSWSGDAVTSTQYCHWAMEVRAYGSSDPWCRIPSATPIITPTGKAVTRRLSEPTTAPTRSASVMRNISPLPARWRPLQPPAPATPRPPRRPTNSGR